MYSCTYFKIELTNLYILLLGIETSLLKVVAFLVLDYD